MLSVIIPTLNEANHIGDTLRALEPYRENIEVIVADGGSEDGTIAALDAFPWVQRVECAPGRGIQMNAGAEIAVGDTFLFLHADTLLEEGWFEAASEAVKTPGFAIGAFTFSLRSGRPAYRIIEWGVRWRSRLFRLPYGDQGLFLPANAFRDHGGFPEIPIMEDVELVWTHRPLGRLVILRKKASTSARRWERDGLCRRTLMNWKIYSAYKKGKPIGSLAASYCAGKTAIGLFCKQPEPGRVKTRLAATIGTSEATRVYERMVRDTLVHAKSCRGEPDVVVFFDPPDAEQEFSRWLGSGQRYVAQAKGDLGDRMLAAFQWANRNNYTRFVLIGTDCPSLTSKHLEQAIDHLSRHDVVLGPTDDGGYYLVAAGSPHPQLFQQIPWSTNRVFNDTCRAARLSGLHFSTLEQLRDVDNEEDLEFHRSSGATL